jgi:hypothetical protein
MAQPCPVERGGRDKPGHDPLRERRSGALLAGRTRQPQNKNGRASPAILILSAAMRVAWRSRQLTTIVLMRFGTSPTGIDLTNFMFGASTTEIEREPALEM